MAMQLVTDDGVRVEVRPTRTQDGGRPLVDPPIQGIELSIDHHPGDEDPAPEYVVLNAAEARSIAEALWQEASAALN